MYIVKERRWVYGEAGVTEVEWGTRSIYSGDPGVDRQHSFSSHLVIPQTYTLYLSQLLFSLDLSEISWIHAIAWILKAV
jgi:hypothetical protein